MGKQHSKQLEQYVKVTEVFRGLAAWRNNECWCVRSMGRKDGQGPPSMLRTDDSPCISHAAVNSDQGGCGRGRAGDELGRCLAGARWGLEFQQGMEIRYRVSVLRHFSRVRLCATLWTAACQAPLTMGFLR